MIEAELFFIDKKPRPFDPTRKQEKLIPTPKQERLFDPPPKQGNPIPAPKQGEQPQAGLHLRLMIAQ